jgi:carboxymethylenebutenolidase
MSRRAFLDEAQKFATTGVTAAALFEILRPNYAWGIQVPPDDKRLATERDTVASPQGSGSIRGYLARPAGSAKLSVVLVVHENRGLNPYIEDVARRLAVAGYVAFAPDGLTSVGGYPGDDEKAAMLFGQVGAGTTREDFFASALWLKAGPDGTGKLGAVGFCYGGGVVNQLAARIGTNLVLRVVDSAANL